MSRWRCKCGHIIDNNIWACGNKCPICKLNEPDLEWVHLSVDESECLWLEQKNKEQKETIKRLLEKLKETEELLKESVKYLEEGKRKFSPNTTNSFVDDFLSQIKKREEERIKLYECSR